MSRSGKTAPRTLSLTEELEKLEQSITLTLQEIDSNFSKAHRIVTTNILPLVEQYGEHSRAVWEATKFWKQFFEASANVSLSGYEELTHDEDTSATATEESSAMNDVTISTATDGEHTPRARAGSGHGQDHNHTNLTNDESTMQQARRNGSDDSLLSDGDGDLSGSTPRPPATRTVVVPSVTRPQFANLGSPYEALKREMKSETDAPDGGHAEEDEEDDDTEMLFQQHTARLPNMSMTPWSSLGARVDTGLADDDTMGQDAETGQNKDRLLHRVLDKNYRLMATPHKGIATGVSPIKWKVTANDVGLGNKGKQKENVPIWQQDSPMSSPEMAVPTLRSAAFMSPMRAAYRQKFEAADASRKAPRTPGVSVQTPGGAGGKKTRDVYAEPSAGQRKTLVDEITWDSDSDEEALRGISPPKTIQFALPPPSKLMQTPAREASKRIVDDILLMAGAELDESSELGFVSQTNADLLDDTF